MKRILLSAFAFALYAGAATAIETNDSGVYQIATASDLVEFASIVNGTHSTISQDSYAWATVTADIDASGVSYTPIGTSSYYYEGTFDGGGHTITLNIGSKSSCNQALFGCMRNGTIKNVTVAGTVTGQMSVAGIVSLVSPPGGETATISGCTNKATITGTNQYVGGIVGQIGDCWGTVIISDCQNEGGIPGSPYSCGGIVGGSDNGVTVSLSKCINSGDITASLSYSEDYAGGLIGWVNGSTYTMENCANHGTVASGNGVSGTLAGYVGSGTLTMTGCYNSAESTVPTIGSNSGTLTMTRCYDINSTRTDGANAFTESEMKSGALCYSLNDSKTSEDEAVWRQTIDTDNYPVLSGSIVYYGYASCTATEKTYTNDAAAATHTTAGHNYENCVCTYCGDTNHESMTSGVCDKCGYYEALTDADKQNGYYQISNAGQLMAFADIVNGTNGAERNIWANATVTADIDFTDITSATYTPMGSNSRNRQYAGTFDGGGHTITLKINNTSSNYQGLFAVIGDDSYGVCHIKNVVVAGTIAGSSYVGGIAGMVKYGTTPITNCTNKATISGTYWVGGIVGYVEQEATISGCENTGSVTASTQCAGGIVGFTCANLSVSGCVNNGSVTSSKYAGGLLGYANANSSSTTYTFTIENSANHGTVSGSSSGTLVGYVYGSSGTLAMTGCYNSATDSSLGALGYAKKSTFTRCYDINSTSTTSGALACTSTEMTDGTLCYNLNGGVSSIAWYQKLTGEDADSYPVLTALADEANVVNKGTLKEYGAETGSDIYFNSTTLVANSDATKFYQLDLVGATATATSNLKSNCTEASKNILVQDGENWYCGYAELQDGTAYSIDKDYTAAKFTYSRTDLPAGGISTFILPAAISAGSVNGTVYKLAGYDGETLKFDEATDELSANTPYLVKNCGATLLTGTLENVAVSAMTAGSVTVTGDSGTATHIGSYAVQTSENAESGCAYYDYTASEGTFVKATGTWTLNPFRTMIKVKSSEEKASLALQFSDEVTGISSPALESSPVDVYTISGAQVRSQADPATALQGLPNGFYIVGGKKVVKK